MSRPVHTGIHHFGLAHDGISTCEVCGFSVAATIGHQCSGIRNILGRPQDLSDRGIASEPRLEGIADSSALSGPLANGSVRLAAAPRSGKKRRGISPATPEQRFKARGSCCVVCGLSSVEATIDPAHLLPRGMLSEGQDDPLAVVPLCRRHHNEYDRELLDLSSYLEPGYREEVAFAVARAGLFPVLRRITNRRWTPEPSESAA